MKIQTDWLTKKQLQNITGVPAYIIDYLYYCRRLDVKEAKGKGYPRLYSTSSIQIIKDHLVKSSENE